MSWKRSYTLGLRINVAKRLEGLPLPGLDLRGDVLTEVVYVVINKDSIENGLVSIVIDKNTR